MKLRKWNYDEKAYEPYEVPDEWHIRTMSPNMDELVNCPHCGKQLRFGDTYTSKEIHTEFGIGYGVCLECYENEFERERREYDKSKQFVTV